MKIKVFYPNSEGKIELSKEKLEALLNEAYNEGYRDGKNSNYYYSPYFSTITENGRSICSNDVTLLSSDSASGSVCGISSVEKVNATNDNGYVTACVDGTISSLDTTISSAKAYSIKVEG